MGRFQNEYRHAKFPLDYEQLICQASAAGDSKTPDILKDIYAVEPAHHGSVMKKPSAKTMRKPAAAKAAAKRHRIETRCPFGRTKCHLGTSTSYCQYEEEGSGWRALFCAGVPKYENHQELIMEFKKMLDESTWSLGDEARAAGDLFKTAGVFSITG